MHITRRVLGRFAAFPLLLATVTVPPAQAEDSAPPAPVELVSVGSVTVETYTSNFKKLVSRVTYGAETEGIPQETDEVGITPGGGVVAMGSGSGGSSTSSGCRKVTVQNETETALGFTAYWYNTWTRWCWTRSTQVVYSVTTGWTISDVDPNFYWKGEVNKELLFYDYSTNDGHPKSAYKHYRQGQFDNCVFKYGCIGTSYPANTLRSYYNGTWAWATEG